MTREKRFMGILAVLLIGLAAHGARIGSAQVGTPAGSPATPPGATPAGMAAGASCTEIGSMPGWRLVMTIDERPGQTISPEMVDRTIAILARRATSVSPAGCEVLEQANGSIQVTLAASEDLDADTAVSTVSGSAQLEIVDTGGTFPEVGTTFDPLGTRLLESLGLSVPSATPASGTYAVILSGADVVDAVVTRDPAGMPQVLLTLTDEAAARFATYTAEHIGDSIAILLDGEVVSVPVIQAEITGGEVVIQGNFTETEAQTLAIQLQAGALPVTLTFASVDLVTPDGQAEDVPIGEVDGVEIISVETAQHTTETVNYPQSPPAGGMHDPAWQNCGFYDAPIRNENAVHSLEHGAVWITYQPDLPPVEVDALRQLVLVNDRLIVSPYPGLDSPIVLSTWDRQLRLDTVDDPRLFEFIDTYTNQAPEPNASCQGQIGTPA